VTEILTLSVISIAGLTLYSIFLPSVGALWSGDIGLPFQVIWGWMDELLSMWCQSGEREPLLDWQKAVAPAMVRKVVKAVVLPIPEHQQCSILQSIHAAPWATELLVKSTGDHLALR